MEAAGRWPQLQTIPFDSVGTRKDAPVFSLLLETPSLRERAARGLRFFRKRRDARVMVLLCDYPHIYVQMTLRVADGPSASTGESRRHGRAGRRPASSGRAFDEQPRGVRVGGTTAIEAEAAPLDVASDRRRRGPIPRNYFLTQPIMFRMANRGIALRSWNYARVFQPTDFFPVEAEFEQYFFRMLSQLGRHRRRRPWRAAEVARRRDHLGLAVGGRHVYE